MEDARKPLRSKLLAVPALRQRYLAYVQDIAEKWLDWRVIHPLVRQWQALIEPGVIVDTRKIHGTEAFYDDVADSAEKLHTGAGKHAARVHRAEAGVSGA